MTHFTNDSLDLIHRPRRLRRSAAIRGLVRETRLSPEQLIQPLFVKPGEGIEEDIDTMPGQYRRSVDKLIEYCQKLETLGVNAVNLFGYCEDKTELADAAVDPSGLIPSAIQALKIACPGMCVQTDLALDPYTPHGHDGLVEKGDVVNDPTVDVLCRMALVHAEAGVDWVSPSDMMDGRVGAIRDALDEEGYSQVGILSYSAKYASGFYGPFRGALQSAPRSGDKKSYQMDPANRREAMREIQLDLDEGADVVMIKPALPNLDILAEARETFDCPIAAYQVSGEYAMIKAAAEKGWIDEPTAMMESLTSIVRAGADMILTYFAEHAAQTLN